MHSGRRNAEPPVYRRNDMAVPGTAPGPVSEADEDTRRHAQLVLAERALDQSDPVGWLGEMLHMLGLHNRPSRAPGTCTTCGGALTMSHVRGNTKLYNRSQCRECSEAAS